ncbi:MAG: CDP-alcohol phosphatidyltransferase family protein [Deferrisomatales bacterium]|nr:CDP-alcohol phosphatidyltransferase family protein [Deferrisomatales bacterium]
MAYLPILLEIVLPVLVLLAAERFAVYRFLRTPAQVAWVRSHSILWPNSISRLRYPMGFVAVAVMHLGWPKLAFLFFAFWMITDITDGDIARRCGLSTERGETIDPLSDKLMYTPVLLYFAWQGLLTPWLVGLFLVFDFTGQFSRRFIPRKAANLFGKAKTFLVVVLLSITAVVWIYGPAAHLLPLSRTIRPLLAFCTGLAFCSMAFRVIPNYWYANILSLLNLTCGLAGIGVILSGGPPVYAFGLVFLGQFLDLFDGRAAERWGSTPKGEVFDDVADGTSFGATVGLIVAVSFRELWVGAALGLLHLGATVYRLIRFVREKRKAGIPGGVSAFAGLPSPAAALMAGTACLLVGPELWKGVLVAATSVAMVSRLPYPHFGRTVLPRVPKAGRVLFLAFFLVLLAQGVRRDDYFLPLGIVFVGSLVYLVSPLFHRQR